MSLAFSSSSSLEGDEDKGGDHGVNVEKAVATTCENESQSATSSSPNTSSKEEEEEQKQRKAGQRKRDDIMTKAGRKMDATTPQTGSDQEEKGDNDSSNDMNNGKFFNFALPSKEGAREHAKKEHGHQSCRVTALHFIHRTAVQRTMMILLLLDDLILFMELFLLALYPQCNLVERDCIACCPEANNVASAGSERWLAGGKGGSEEEALCDAGYSNNIGEPTCDTHM